MAPQHVLQFIFLTQILTLWKRQICLRVEINENDGSAIFDFEGTGCEVRGNLNSPVSVVHSAVIYCMRAMLDVDIPLNAGCLVPLDGNFLSSASLFSLNFCGSPNSQWKSIVTITHCSRLRWKCAHLTAYRRCRAAGIQCLRSQSGMHK